MAVKALILDLDNTIYAVESIGEDLFKSLFDLIKKSGEFSGDLEDIKRDVMKKPFQTVASDYQFSESLTDNGTKLLQELTYEGKIEPFEDYRDLRKIPIDKYLVTTGFKKLQQSKVDGMQLDRDFKEIHIVDPATSDLTKKDVFADIIQRHGYEKDEVLVVGDDPDSEIGAGEALGTAVVLYDKMDRIDDPGALNKIRNFKQLEDFLI